MTDKLKEEIRPSASTGNEEDQTEQTTEQTEEGEGVGGGNLLRAMPPSIMRDLQTRLDKKALPLDESNPQSMVIIQKVYDNYIKKRERARVASAKTRAAKKSELSGSTTVDAKPIKKTVKKTVTEQVDELDTEQVDELDTEQVNELATEQVTELKQVEPLDNEQVTELDAEQVNELYIRPSASTGSVVSNEQVDIGRASDDFDISDVIKPQPINKPVLARSVTSKNTVQPVKKNIQANALNGLIKLA
jgi:hypothetical protein